MDKGILARINEVILDEKGLTVSMDSKFLDSKLDSLGVMLTLVTLDSDYPFLADVPNDVDIVEYLKVETLTIRELVTLCRLSITDSLKEQNEEINT